MLSAIMLSVIMLSVIILSVIMLSVVALWISDIIVFSNTKLAKKFGTLKDMCMLWLLNVSFKQDVSYSCVSGV